VRILQDLEQFKDLPMYVRCIESPSNSSSKILEKDDFFGARVSRYGC
jgi:hypothetical protein